jgi:indolepyruvate ferredoxin oxidoreductase
MLRRMRRLRGTPFDVFGWDADRRLERAIIEEFDTAMREARGDEGGLAYDDLVALARSPQEIRGYAAIKERAVEEWRARLPDLVRPRRSDAAVV